MCKINIPKSSPETWLLSMVPATLSSNWKLLQQKLQRGIIKDKLLKRKATEAVDINPSKKLVKRPGTSLSGSKIMLTSADYTKSVRKMATETASISLTSWGEENGIPAADLAQAYNLPSTYSLSTKASVEVVAVSEVDPSKTEVGRYIAIDCEMVGVGGEGNERSALARVSIVNYHGHLILDTFVKPREKVTDWRTWVSGVSPASMKTAITYEEVQKRVSDILQGRILVGHAVKNDLEVFLLSHPKRDIRDTSRHPQFRKLSNGRTPGLKKLAKELLGIEIQGGEHSSVEDARASMSLYRLQRDEFEALHAAKYPNHANKQKSKGGGSNNKKKKKKNKTKS